MLDLDLSLNAGAALALLGGGGGGGLQAFAFEAETTTLAAAMTSAGATVSSRRQYMIDRWIRKWKAAGVWAKLIELNIITTTQAASYINWKSPGTRDLVLTAGTPTFEGPEQAVGSAASTTAGFRYGSWSAANNLRSGTALNSLSQNNVCFGVLTYPSTANANPIGGVYDGTAGLSLIPLPGSTNGVQVRAMGTQVTVGTNSDTSGIGVFALNRNNSATFDLWRNGIKTTVASASVAPTTSNPITYGIANGAATGTTARWRGAFIGQSMTDAQMDLLSRGIQSIYDSFAWGDVVINEAGYAPASVSAEVIVYGWTLQGVIAAYEAKRQGRTVALLGGWDDHSPQDIGGVSANGLGKADADTAAAYGGLVKTLMANINAGGYGSGSWLFEPRGMNFMLRQLLDPARSVGQDVQLYETSGVLSVAKTGTTITSVTCADGRTYTGSQFIDASYEGDLMALAGASYATGIEAAGSGLEALNGYRGKKSDNVETNSNSYVGATYVAVDPYVTAGVSGSGLLPGAASAPALSVGAADTTTQAYTMRQTLQSTQARRMPLPSTPRVGYSASTFELLGRFLGAATAASLSPALSNIVLATTLTNNVQDFNNRGIQSIDVLDSGNQFAACTTYAQRRTLKASMFNYYQDLYYYLQYDGDSRIPSAVRTSMLGYGFDPYHYIDPGPDDQAYRTSKIYVREFRRLVGDIVWNANDLSATDGTTPRSTKTVAVASYSFDSHVHRTIVDSSTGSAAVWNSGNFSSGSGGPNLMAPLPREIFLPKQAELTNLGVAFAVSATHVAFGAIRMELTTMQAAQSLAVLAAMALEGGTTMALVDDTAFRTRMNATPETATYAMVLPQVN
jgi:hypothetical protein